MLQVMVRRIRCVWSTQSPEQPCYRRQLLYHILQYVLPGGCAWTLLPAVGSCLAVPQAEPAQGAAELQSRHTLPAGKQPFSVF